MECDICSNWIDDKYGHNAEPIFKGKCCDECNMVFVIPARLGSKRLKDKPLINLKGKTMIERTYLQCCLLYTSPSPRDATLSRMPSSA